MQYAAVMIRPLTASAVLVLAVAFYACTDDDPTPPLAGFDAGSFDASRPDATSSETGAADAPSESGIDTGAADAEPDASDAGPGNDAAVDASDACVRSTGLVAWWPGDGTAQDIVGGNDGT